MAVSIKNRIETFFSKGNERTLLAKKNIILSVFYKGGSILISLLIVPITINYVNASQYGIWITLSSIISWFSLFDIGLGNGLKNKLAEANALMIINKSKAYISTTYAILFFISSLFFVAFILFNRYINWQSVLNSQTLSNNYLSVVTLLLIGLFSLQFVTQIINSILTAFHRPSTVALITLIGQTFSLSAVIFLKIYQVSNSLIWLVFAMAGLPLIIQILASIYFFAKKYKEYSPAISHVNFSYSKELLSVGGKFFFIQIGALILFQTDNILVTQIFGPKQVTVFNVAYKLFSVLTLLFSIIITPYWSAYTDAYAKNDWQWIKNSMAKMKKILIGLSLLSCLLLVLSNPLYNLWLKGKVTIPFSLSVAMAIYVISFGWQSMYVYFLNGIGKIKLQLYLVVISSILNIPLAFVLSKYWGLAGVTYSNTILFVLMGTAFYIQSKRIIAGTAKGIMND